MIKAIAEIEHRPYLLIGVAAAAAVLYIRHNASLAVVPGTTGPGLNVQPGGVAGIGATGSNFQTGSDPSIPAAIAAGFQALQNQITGAVTGQPAATPGLSINNQPAPNFPQYGGSAPGSQGQNTLPGTNGYTYQQANTLLHQQEHIAQLQAQARNPFAGCQGFGCVGAGVSTIGSAIGSIFGGGGGGFLGGLFGGGGSRPSPPSGGVVGGARPVLDSSVIY